MLICGYYERDRHEDTGRFVCPACACEREFVLIRTWTYFHVYFIPVAKQGLVAERVVCQQCEGTFPVTVLVEVASNVPTAFDAGNKVPQSVSDNFGNIVQLTATAADEVRRRHAKAHFGNDIVIRVEPDRLEPRTVKISFDFVVADGRDWIGQSHAIPIVIDRVVAPELHGVVIDYIDGEFVRK